MPVHLSLTQMKPWVRALDSMGSWLRRFRHYPSNEHISPKKLLFICLDDITEVIRLLPFLQLLGEHFPTGQYDFLVGDWSQPLVKNHPMVDSVIGFNAPWLMQHMISPELPSKQGFYNLVWEIRRKQYDTVVCARPDFRMNLLSAFTGAPIRIGHGASGGGFLLTHDLPWNPQKNSLNMHMDFASVFNIRPYYIAPKIVPCDDDVQTTKSMIKGLSSSHPIVVVYPGGSHVGENWSPQKYIELIAGLNQSDKQVLLLGGPGETDLLNTITEDYSGALLQIWNFPSYGEIAALATMINTYIGTVSSTSQIMTAAGAPSIILTRESDLPSSGFIGSRIETINPLSCCSHCRTLNPESTRSSCECMSHITVEQVLKICCRKK